MTEEMFRRQFDLQTRVYGNNFPEMTNEERIEFIRWNVLALEDELHEALSEVGWKPWASDRRINRDAYAGELVDAWHFLMNLMLVVGMTGEELERRYMKKAAVNEERQADGYDGWSGKCRSCYRDLKEAPEGAEVGLCGHCSPPPEGMSGGITHAVPEEATGGMTPCCGKTPFELPRTDRMTSFGPQVTCPGVVQR